MINSPRIPMYSWTRSLAGWALFLFVSGATFLNGPNHQRIIGALLGVAAIAVFTTCRPAGRARILNAPKELVFFSLWVLWLLTGAVVADNPAAFWSTYQVVLQVMLALWFVWILLAWRPSLMPAVLFALVFGALINLGYIALTGQLAIGGGRVTGLGNNSNGLAIHFIRAALSLLIIVPLLRSMPKRLREIALFGLLGILIYGILLTGSRKGLLAIVLMLGLWFMWAYPIRAGKGAGITRIIATFGFVCTVYFLLPWILDNTTAGARLVSFIDGGSGSVSAAAESNIRYEMHLAGLEMFANNPIFGVGLGNFSHHFYTGQYSHSDYIEPLATGGFIGFALYHSFLLSLLWRLLTGIRRVHDLEAKYVLKVLLIGTLTYALIGTGVPYLINHLHFVSMLVSLCLVLACRRGVPKVEDTSYRVASVP